MRPSLKCSCVGMGECSLDLICLIRDRPFRFLVAGRAVIFQQLIFLNKAKAFVFVTINEPRHDISNNVVCATSKGSDQPEHTRSLIRAFASRLNIL